MAELEKNIEAAEEQVNTSADAEEPAPEEESTAEFKPVVELEDVDTVSGEEDEDCVYEVRAKLFRFGESDLERGTGKCQWLTKGIGTLKILKHRQHSGQRLLMRADKTHKILVNTLVHPELELSKMDLSENSWVFHCWDFSTGEELSQHFGLKLKSAEDFDGFADALKKAQGEMKAVLAGSDANETAADAKETNEATEALANLSTKDDAPQEEEPSKE